MNTIGIYTVKTMKWTALAGGYGLFLIGGLIAISWLLLQFLVFLVQHLS
jgi:hypothetical protein